MMTVVTAPMLLCPSMNTNMYKSIAVQRNLDILRGDGHNILEPNSGELACGTVGPGRLPEPDVILDRLIKCLTPKDLKQKKVLVTAGATQELIDPVRYISNPSSGKMGYAAARSAEHRGAEVTLISGPTHLEPPVNIEMIQIRSAEEMAQAVLDNAEHYDIIIKTAAVSDYRPLATKSQKIKKTQKKLTLELAKTVDILKELGQRKTNQVLVGFAAETEELDKNANKKLTEKNLDIIAGNIIGVPGSGFQCDTNKVTLYYRDGSREELAIMGKEDLAHILLDRSVERLTALRS
jgi:phosphopantothenoylcysteine decarboxylase/phosphopantothenate--cysteine ligase